jgi:hypothetical protein
LSSEVTFSMKKSIWLFLICFGTSLCSPGQGIDEKREILILFLDEPLPVGASKILTKKVSEPYEGYQRFEERIRKLAGKYKGNLAKVEDYHAPDRKHLQHQGVISIYSFENIELLRQKVENRRDSLVASQLSDANVNSLVYVFRPWTTNKIPYDLFVDERLAKKMKPDSTITIKPGDKASLTLSATTLTNGNNIIIRPKPGRIYYVECRTVGSGFAMFPLFNVVDSHVGKFLFEALSKDKKN